MRKLQSISFFQKVLPVCNASRQAARAQVGTVVLMSTFLVPPGQFLSAGVRTELGIRSHRGERFAGFDAAAIRTELGAGRRDSPMAVAVKRAAIYVRVSTDSQTVENQLRELRQVAERARLPT
jgi:hypothetical protein